MPTTATRLPGKHPGTFASLGGTSSKAHLSQKKGHICGPFFAYLAVMTVLPQACFQFKANYSPGGQLGKEVQVQERLHQRLDLGLYVEPNADK